MENFKICFKKEVTVIKYKEIQLQSCISLYIFGIFLQRQLF